MSVKKLDFPLQCSMAEDNRAMSTKFQKKENVYQTYYIPLTWHSSINAKGRHSQIRKNSRNAACMHEPFLKT